MGSPIWAIFFMVISVPSYSEKGPKNRMSFMKVLLTSGKSLIGKILQPAVTRHGTFLLNKHALSRTTLHVETKPHKTEPHETVPRISTPKNLKKDFKAPALKHPAKRVSLTPIPAKAPEYIGPFRNIPKKNWKKTPGSIGLHDPVSQDLFSEIESAPGGFWERSGTEVWTTAGKAPIEILLGLGRCLNEAASLTISPSGRTIDIDNQVFVKPNFFAPQDRLLFQRAACRFDVKGDYRVIGDNINAPFNPLTWNIKVKEDPSSQILKKKRAIGLCLQLRNNTAFTVMTPRYTNDGKVKRSGALVQDLEQKCSHYPFTFLSSFFVPG